MSAVEMANRTRPRPSVRNSHHGSLPAALRRAERRPSSHHQRTPWDASRGPVAQAQITLLAYRQSFDVVQVVGHRDLEAGRSDVGDNESSVYNAWLHRSVISLMEPCRRASRIGRTWATS